MNYREIEKQRPGRNKKTAINRQYINSGEYRKKYDNISNSPRLNRMLYKLGKRMLEHRSGTYFEDMYWIDLDTYQIVAQELNSDMIEEIQYSDRTISVINEYRNNSKKRLLTIHSHPNSYPPSYADFMSNYQNDYVVGVIVCHNGKIFIYSAKQVISEVLYNLTIAKYIKQGYNDYEALNQALNEISKHYDIIFKEVKSDGNGK